MATNKKATTSQPEPPAFKGLELWKRIERTDPAFVKPITGKAYKGNSPHPTWLVKQLTSVLGPVGHGFGWRVLQERYVDGKPVRVMTGPNQATVVFEKMHECRIEFWTMDPDTKEVGTFESYGCTKALYQKRGTNDWIDDEDAPKKSLTDAITKAMSFIGGAADIFLGRWDDNKYLAENSEHWKAQGSAEAPVTPGVPQGRGAQKAIEDSAPDPLHDSWGDNGDAHVSGSGDPGF